MKIKETLTEYGISVVAFDENNKVLGVSECSIMNMITPLKKQEDCLYFNRIFVKPEYRNKGIGKEILSRMLKIVEDLELPISCDINPYGDLNYNELHRWYISFGFKEYEMEYKGFRHKQLWFNLKESV